LHKQVSDTCENSLSDRFYSAFLNQQFQPMSKDFSATINDIIDKRKATAGDPNRIAENLRSLASSVENLKRLQYTILSLPGPCSDEHQKNLTKLNLDTISQRIAQELKTWEMLYQRLSRDTINIGVIGLARQGKSTFLQNVAGLTDEVIPSSDRMPCTSVQSNIYHSDENTNAKVYFHSESSFMEEVIKPYFEELRLPNPPKTLKEFRRLSIGSQPDRLTAKSEAVFNHLKDYHNYVEKYQDELQPIKRHIQVPRERIKEYVSQDYHENGKPRYFKHLAVAKVDIFCPFPEMKVKKIGLVDMPGLGDTRLGDAKRMIDALGKDIDFILFVRRPNHHGDLWRGIDIDLYDEAASALKNKLPLEEWSFLLLNQDGNNEQQCDDLDNTRVDKGVQVKKTLRGNCKNKESANEVIKEVLTELATNMNNLDRLYMDTSFRQLSMFQHTLSQEILEIRSDAESLGDSTSTIINLRDNFIEKLIQDIEDFRSIIREELKEPNEEFRTQIDSAINRCKQEVTHPDPLAFDQLVKLEGSTSAAYCDVRHQMRASLLQIFHSVETGLQESLYHTKSRLADLLISQRLDRIVPQNGTEFLRLFSEILSKKNEFKNLSLGFNFIVSFEIMYKGFIQSQIWQVLNQFLPPDPKASVNSPATFSSALTSLQQDKNRSIEECHKEMARLAESINFAQISMIEEFSDHITRAKGVKQEWETLLMNNRLTIWPELETIEQYGNLQKDWMRETNEILTNIQKLKP
jgi:hypothetical protein